MKECIDAVDEKLTAFLKLEAATRGLRDTALTADGQLGPPIRFELPESHPYSHAEGRSRK